jgi:hypothetical protein
VLAQGLDYRLHYSLISGSKDVGIVLKVLRGGLLAGRFIFGSQILDIVLACRTFCS